MTANSSVSSNALNFASSMRNGVDPRIGLYKISIDFPEVQANHLRGPGYSASLNFSSLNSEDSGYGRGWDLNVSQYNLGKQILSLSTGETFKVTGRDSVTGQLTMKEKKLDSFHFYKLDETRYRVEHKSGVVEILEVHGSGQRQVALPVEIYSVTGHKISLGYRPFSGTHQILEWIKDDTGQTLLMVKRDEFSVEVLLHPFAGADGGPLARYIMTLEGSDKHVKSITLPTENQAAWRFGYRYIDEQLCVVSVDTPTGAREEIDYKDLGHQFPEGSGRKPLPRVTDHRIFPGPKLAVIDTRYTYPGGNTFVGSGLRIVWDDDGLDNLFKYPGIYDYKTVEALWVDGQEKRSIERTFNKYHLLISETTTQNNNVQTVETTYYLTPGASYEQQPNYCQLPKDVTTSWTVKNTSRYRSETVNSTYDTHGNLLTRTQANGVVETTTWYPAADANDFVRHVNERTVTPAASSNGQAPTLCTRYAYKELRPLTGSPLRNWWTTKTVTLLQLEGKAEIELQRTELTYTDKPTDSFVHGRVERQEVTMNGKSSFTDYQYLPPFDSPELGESVQQITQTLSTDFDTVSKTTVRQYSAVTSHELSSLVDGVETRYTYDALNRLTSEVVGPDTPYEARRDYEYTLSAAYGQPAEHVLINAKRIRLRTVHDGIGRAIFAERDHVDNNDPGRTHQTIETVYDGWNNLVKETLYDRLDGEDLALTTCYEYDDWAQRCKMIGPDGVEQHQRIDPIGTDDSKGPVQRSWVQSPGPVPSISGQSETWLNHFGKPSRIRTLDATGKEVSTQLYEYDGLGRCTKQIDPYNRSTEFSYDPWSRMTTTTLPDKSVVKREYAAHSSSELQVAISVRSSGGIDILAGEREFDGLGRLTRLTTGQRTERYAYEDGQMQVREKTTAAGETITYDYNRTLTHQPIASFAPDESSTFTYDRTSARLTGAENNEGKRQYDYNAGNQLLAERWVDDQGKTWNTLYSTSVQGRLLKRTDLKHEGDDGLDTVYHYDAVGRLECIEQGQLKVSLEYNSLGQLLRTTTEDLAAKSKLITELEFDDQGRETLRTLKLNDKPPRTQEQAWRLDGLLEGRHLQQDGVSLLKEKFAYDARSRLITHECSGSTLPRDQEGRAFVVQMFDFDALDNLKILRTEFEDGTDELARFTYALNDPCVLEKIIYTPPRTTGNPTFTYDPNGNQLNDERGQRLTYDSQNRLLHVEDAGGQLVSQYRYDGHDHLVNSQQGNQSETLRFYQGEQLNAVVQDEHKTRILYHLDQPLGQQQAGDDEQTLLLLTDANHSVIGESQQQDLRTAVYSAYGERHSDDILQSLLGFNGELCDNASGWYLLGRGYRVYHPGQKRFFSPDSSSPFGSGGVNPYCYCLGNPIALRDPTGHSAIGFSGRLRRPDEDITPQLSGGRGDVGSWIGVAIGAVFTVVSVGATFGALAPVAAAVWAGAVFTTALIVQAIKAALLLLGAVASVASTALSAISLANGDEEAGTWGMYLGLAAIPTTVGAAAFGKIAGATARAAASGWQEMVDDIPALLKSMGNSAGAEAGESAGGLAAVTSGGFGYRPMVPGGGRFVRKPSAPTTPAPTGASRAVASTSAAMSGAPSNTDITNQLNRLKPVATTKVNATSPQENLHLAQIKAATSALTKNDQGYPAGIGSAAQNANTSIPVDPGVVVTMHPRT